MKTQIKKDRIKLVELLIDQRNGRQVDAQIAALKSKMVKRDVPETGNPDI